MYKTDMTVHDVFLGNIRNRNERRVALLLPEVLEEYSDYIFDPLDIEDMYALTLNLLPARYIQPGTIVLQDKLSDEEIKSKMRRAIEKVLDNPTRADSDK